MRDEEFRERDTDGTTYRILARVGPFMYAFLGMIIPCIIGYYVFKANVQVALDRVTEDRGTNSEFRKETEMALESHDKDIAVIKVSIKNIDEKLNSIGAKLDNADIRPKRRFFWESDDEEPSQQRGRPRSMPQKNKGRK